MIDCIFTSINNSYLPKARILAASVRKHQPEAKMVLMLSDRRDPALDYRDFDLVLSPEDVITGVESLDAWIFEHTVVELCTAVKPFAFRHLFDTYGYKSIVYQDPDTVLYSRLVELESELQQHPVILTPHVTVPAEDTDDLLDGEMLGCLRHGVFNLGFLALTNKGEGPVFLQWWLDRCREYCFDDNQRGLFTDQKWVDLAPCFFQSLKILRLPSYNVATWNLYYRKVEKLPTGEIVVNRDFPLRFYHFSGFDLGTHEHMLSKHDANNECLREMTDWYSSELKRLSNPDGCVGEYENFPNGRSIPADWRRYYRSQPALKSLIPHPFEQYEAVIGHFEGAAAPFLQSSAAPRWVELIRRHRGIVAVLLRILPISVQERFRARWALRR